MSPRVSEVWIIIAPLVQGTDPICTFDFCLAILKIYGPYLALEAGVPI